MIGIGFKLTKKARHDKVKQSGLVYTFRHGRFRLENHNYMDEKGLEIGIEKPIKLEPNQEWVCNYLDCLNEKEKICAKGVLPSNLIRGALATIRNKKTNPDWMAQSAHSYRELLYGLDVGKKHVGNKKEITKADKIGEVMQVLHEHKKALEIAKALNRSHRAFSNISHHFSKRDSKKDTIKIFEKFSISIDKDNFPQDKDFNALIRVFENIVKSASLDPLKIHEKIDSFITEKSRDVPYLRLLFSLNYDAKRYLFSQVNETWLTWLWNKGFLDEIKNKATDATRISYRLPELDYLTRMAEKNPVSVTKIIKSVKISEENFNQEVIDRFIWAIGTLPVGQVKRLTAKIQDEKWMYLMRNFPKNGYELERIVKKLAEKKESKAILEFAQAILTVRSKAEIAEKGGVFSSSNPFYASDLDASGIFEALANIEDDYVEKALQITTEIMADITKLAEPDDTKVFDYTDLFSLFDVDFFTLEIGHRNSYFPKEDVQNLAATIKRLIVRAVGNKCDKASKVKKVFDFVDKLPFSRSMWRLRLFTMSQCPEVFREELKKAFMKLFDVGERYFEIEGGAEYHQALIRGFKILNPKTEQRDYVKKVIGYFNENLKDEDKKAWRKRDGIEILSLIKEHLTPQEKKRVEDEFGVSIDKIEYIPQPTVGESMGGMVQHKSPVKLEDFTIEQIIANLQSIWTPDKLNEQFKNDGFLNPRGVEGLGDALKDDLKKRIDEYLKHINVFVDRAKIHPHYMYSLLRGIEEILRNKQSLKSEQVTQIIELFEKILDEGIKSPFKRKDDKSWLADWIEVHKVMTDILLFILQDQDKGKRVENHKTHREQIKNLISYLLTIKDSPSKENEKTESSEPYNVAINSVRGRAYEAFVMFAENDGNTLAAETKEIFKKTLADDSLAVRFVIGRYLATFYFRDKKFIADMLPEIFPKDDPGRKDIYLATWEGYLSNTLYDKLFVALKDYYAHAITLDPNDYTQRKYFKGLDECLAIHLALAFVHFDLKMSDLLFVDFWNNTNITRQQEFVSFIGRSCLTRGQVGDEWLKVNKVSKEKLLKFWDWILENKDIKDSKVFAGFGFWMNPDMEVLADSDVIERIAMTLKKSDGDIDWDYGLLKRLPILAGKYSAKTLEIISSYLLDSKNNLNQNRRAPIMYEGEIQESLKIIYTNGDRELKDKVVSLINILIEKGGSMFWGLKDVIK